jgi:hypothetical protein
MWLEAQTLHRGKEQEHRSGKDHLTDLDADVEEQQAGQQVSFRATGNRPRYIWALCAANRGLSPAVPWRHCTLE